MREIPALKPGDTIGIAAPSSPFDRTKFIKGIHVLERLDFKVHYRKDIFDQNRYLAGTDSRRAEEFTELLQDKKIAAVMFARGGYGSQRIIPLLAPAIIREHPKPVVGFSDLTALLAFLRQNCEIPTFYGPVVTQLGSASSLITGEALVRALTSHGSFGAVQMEKTRIIHQGKATGPIVGGCLSLINSSMGTPYELQTDGTILFIEEINEKVYVLDRMMTQLKNCGIFEKVKGIVFGAILPPADEPYDVESMVRDILGGFNGPVVYGFPAGHTNEFVTLPMGAVAELKAELDAAPTLVYQTGLLV